MYSRGVPGRHKQHHCRVALSREGMVMPQGDVYISCKSFAEGVNNKGGLEDRFEVGG